MVRHFLSISNLTSGELNCLITRGIQVKNLIRSGQYVSERPLQGQTVSLIFSKRSTRTRISTEGAVTYLGGHPMFLGKDDIQLGVNESLYDTTRVISSMSSAIVARVGPHSDILSLAKDSSVPVINALCDQFHPMQAIADMITVKEHFQKLDGLKLVWVGDANNVLHDLALACVKLGINVAIATPPKYQVRPEIKEIINRSNDSGASVSYHVDATEALQNADIVVTDTWVSMGEENKKEEKLKDFANFQVTRKMLEKAGVNKNWVFMHCLPRKPFEVDNEVFYSNQSLVFEEAENRLYSAIAIFEKFVVRKGV